jgi:hypothetical protein
MPATIVELGPASDVATRCDAMASALALALEWWGGPA